MEPPATRTRPFWSRTARCPLRGTFKVPAAPQAPVAGLNRSAVPVARPLAPAPPATTTVPSVRRVAVAAKRSWAMSPVGSQGTAQVARGHGRYVSAVLVMRPSAPCPPTTRTRPSSSCADAAMFRGMLMLATGAHALASGSKSSTSAMVPLVPTPPATSTRPSARGIVSGK